MTHLTNFTLAEGPVPSRLKAELRTGTGLDRESLEFRIYAARVILRDGRAGIPLAFIDFKAEGGVVGVA